MTLSIVVKEPDSGTVAVAVVTGVPGVGMVCPFARGGVGAVATQALANPYLGPLILQALTRGDAPDDAIQAALAQDPDVQKGQRQVHVVAADGRTAAYTGGECSGWAGHRCFEGLSVAGNMLTGEAVLTAMIDHYRAVATTVANGVGPAEVVASRLIDVLEAGVGEGGDQRGHRSAALLVAGQGMPILRLHVECSDEPVRELRSMVEQTREIQGYLSGYVEENLVVPLG